MRMHGRDQEEEQTCGNYMCRRLGFAGHSVVIRTPKNMDLVLPKSSSVPQFMWEFVS